MDKEAFDRLLLLLRTVFPHLREGAIRHAANKIGNELRRAPYDIYQVDVSSKPFPKQDGYFEFFIVEASSTSVYVRVTVD